MFTYLLDIIFLSSSYPILIFFLSYFYVFSSVLYFDDFLHIFWTPREHPEDPFSLLAISILQTVFQVVSLYVYLQLKNFQDTPRTGKVTDFSFIVVFALWLASWNTTATKNQPTYCPCLQEYGGIKGEAPLQDTVTALNMDHMQSVFLIAALGWASGILLFVFETVRMICRWREHPANIFYCIHTWRKLTLKVEKKVQRTLLNSWRKYLLQT